jgi:hypothetical protein
VHWPEGIEARGELRRQFVHAIDVAPTILDLVELSSPTSIDGVTQRPHDGESFASTFEDADAPTRDTQYFEMLGCRAIYHDGWKAVAWKALGPMYSPDDDPNMPFEDDVWELFHVAEDFSECNNLAAEMPEKLTELQDLWWREAERHHVLPLDNRPAVAIMEPPPTGIPELHQFVYRPGSGRVPEEHAADVKGRTHTITADVVVPEGGADGVLLAQGSILGGYSLYVADGRLQYVHNYLGRSEDHLEASAPLAPGAHALVFEFESDGRFMGGTARLRVDGDMVAEGAIKRYTPVRFSITDAGLTCGRDEGSAITPRYAAPNPFTGTLHKVVVDLEGDAQRDPNAFAEARLRTQ